MSQPITGLGGHLVFPIGPKNTNLVEDVEILLPVKFRWTPFSGFREDVQNVWANQRPGGHHDFLIGPKNKIGRGCWDLASCQVSLNSVQGFQRRSWKCLSQSQAGRSSCFSDQPKNTNLAVKKEEIWLSPMTNAQTPTEHWEHVSCQVSLNSVQRFQRRSPKYLSQSEAGAAILFFWSPPPPKKKPHKLGKGH